MISTLEDKTYQTTNNSLLVVTAFFGISLRIFAIQKCRKSR